MWDAEHAHKARAGVPRKLSQYDLVPFPRALRLRLRARNRDLGTRLTTVPSSSTNDDGVNSILRGELGHLGHRRGHLGHLGHFGMSHAGHEESWRRRSYPSRGASWPIRS
jgi:hypothetical protein